MSDSNSRRTLVALVFGVLVVSGLIGLMFVDNEHKSVETNELPLANTNYSILPDVKVASSITPKRLASERSTPSEHDQLVISPALEGTSIDGALRANDDGSLVLDIGVRDFFDYFLSIADDVGPEQAIGEIQRYARSYLPEPARTEALELLGNYLRYKQTEFQIQQTPITQTNLGDRDALGLLRTSFDQLKRERQNLFKPEQDAALFGLEDSYANHTLLTLELMADESTNDQQKRAQLAELESKLPEALSISSALTRNDRQRQIAIETELNSTQDDAQLYERLYAQGLEPQQVDAIVQRRQQQREFENIYQRYQREKKRLNSDAKTYDAEVLALQNTFFTDLESRTQAKLRDLRPD